MKTIHSHTVLVRIFRALIGISLLIYLFIIMELPKDLIYYTYQTNLFCATWLLLVAIFPHAAIQRNPVKGALVTYITITGLVYTILLLPYEIEYRGAVSLRSIITHMIVPTIMMLDFVLFRKTGKILWNSLLYWMIYPFAYLILTLVVGWQTGFYAYWFINPDSITSPLALVRNFVLLICLHAVIGSTIVAISKKNVCNGNKAMNNDQEN